MRGVTRFFIFPFGIDFISTHTPHAGRDIIAELAMCLVLISTHTPHAGRDVVAFYFGTQSEISTHTPHAGRDSTKRTARFPILAFQLTRPMRGVTMHI